MKLTKPLVATLFAIMCGYTAVQLYGNTLDDPKRPACDQEVANLFLAWDSGCFYNAYFVESPSLEQLYYEHQMLTRFNNKGGIVQHVLWYRSVFYQRFRNQFPNEIDALDDMHQEFIRSNPRAISAKISYLLFLVDQNESLRAQSDLEGYCLAYIPSSLPNLTEEFYQISRKRGLMLDFKKCFDKAGIDYNDMQKPSEKG